MGRMHSICNALFALDDTCSADHMPFREPGTCPTQVSIQTLTGEWQEHMALHTRLAEACCNLPDKSRA